MMWHMETFGLTLARLLRERNCSVSSWARSVGITQGYASNLILGRRNPPFNRGLAWGKRFKLKEIQLQDFLDQVALAHLPAPYRARLLRLKAENERLRWLVKRQRQPGARGLSRATAADGTAKSARRHKRVTAANKAKPARRRKRARR